MDILAHVLLISVYHAVTAQLVKYDISTQPTCDSFVRAPANDCRWAAGVDSADLVVEKGRIIAYKIQWSAGNWSDWYVSGLNDIDWKFNKYSTTCAMQYSSNSMRHVWSYFFDHTHEFIICKSHSEICEGSCNGTETFSSTSATPQSPILTDTSTDRSSSTSASLKSPIGTENLTVSTSGQFDTTQISHYPPKYSGSTNNDGNRLEKSHLCNAILILINFAIIAFNYKLF